MVGDVWYGTHGLVTNVTPKEEKDASDQPVVRDQFHAGNRLSYFASYPRSHGVILDLGNRTGPSYPLRGPGVGRIPNRGDNDYSAVLIEATTTILPLRRYVFQNPLSRKSLDFFIILFVSAIGARTGF